jgi:hypothetical protein
MQTTIEHIQTFRRATSLTPGNILVTSERDYFIERVSVDGSTIELYCFWYAEISGGLTSYLDKQYKIILLHDIDYVFIKLLIP